MVIFGSSPESNRIADCPLYPVLVFLDEEVIKTKKQG
jgi:hypothetical protein